ncbi:hypothetical protein MKZ38_006071 [Zalerion maritima]|uniref:Uncharacterized protein n=1 Tax=Zalerion maritima TaxID=339359 RepID=A0AAD5WPZ2_9PEZI|nr:hypothetical protein MKZ38_006071 [Zalerion maritima]
MMSLVDLVLPPSRDQNQQTQKQDMPPPTTQQQQVPNSYTPDQQPSPKVQSRDSMDSAVYQEFYAPRSQEEASSDNLMTSKKRKLIEPPALPERSALRASRMLDSISIQSKLDAESTTHMSTSMPHDVYLSSEEEASSSADDFSDYDFDDEELADYDSSSEESQKSPVRRKSHEDTARVVSVIFSGRPSIIDVSSLKRSISPASSVELRPRTSVASNPESFVHTSRPSTSAASTSPPKFHPPRSSSMMLPSTTKLSKHRPTFLNTDPFPNNGGFEMKQQIDEESPRTPRTPTAVLKSVSRTFSLVKKRSRPLLNNFNNSVSSSVSGSHNGSTTDLHNLERTRTPQSMHSSMRDNSPTSPATSNSAFVLHSEPVTRRDSLFSIAAPPMPQQAPRTPLSPAGTVKGRLLDMARRRSIHLKAARV